MRITNNIKFGLIFGAILLIANIFMVNDAFNIGISSANAQTIENENEIAQQEHEQEEDNMENQQNRMESNRKVNNARVDSFADEIPASNYTNESSDAKIQGKIAPCTVFYVRLEGCSYAYRLFSDGYTPSTWLGTANYVGTSYPIYVSQYGTPNQLYWRYGSKKYYLVNSGFSSVRSTTVTSSASWYHLTPGYVMQTSRTIGKQRYYFDYYANVDYCTDSFKIMHGYTGRKVYVDSCY